MGAGALAFRQTCLDVSQGVAQLIDSSRRAQRHEEQSSQLRSLQREHDNLRASSTSRGLASPPAGGDAHLHTRLHEAEELASELRGEVSSLVDEIRQVSERADELQREVERERGEREKAEKEAREWKERWQAVKLELRNVKGRLRDLRLAPCSGSCAACVSSPVYAD